MMIWRKTRLVKKYIKLCLKNELFMLLSPGKNTPNGGIRYSKNLDYCNSEALEKDENPTIVNDIEFVKEEVDSNYSTNDFLEEDLNLKEKIAKKLDQTWQQSLFELIDKKSILYFF